jgi:hypothetical protein
LDTNINTWTLEELQEGLGDQILTDFAGEGTYETQFEKHLL